MADTFSVWYVLTGYAGSASNEQVSEIQSAEHILAPKLPSFDMGTHSYQNLIVGKAKLRMALVLEC